MGIVKHFYLGSAIVGAIAPYAFFVGFFNDEGVGLTTFIEALFANGAAAGFTTDLLMTSAVFWVFMFSHAAGPRPWPLVLVNLLIGLSCAFPLYLYQQQRQNEAAELRPSAR
jgi:hypothetical protein